MNSSQSTSTQPMDPEGETGKLCNWVHSVTLSDIPEEVQTRAKYLILDGLACGLVGAHLPWSEKAANAVFEMDPSGSSAVFGWKRNLPPLSAALLNSSFIQGFELDDWHSEAPMHSNAILLPALLAATDHLNQSEALSTSQSNDRVDGPSFLLAYLVGLEVGPRIGNALYGSHMLSMGWHSGDVFGHPSSALSVSKLMNLPPNLMEDAVGIACTQSGGLMSAQFESEVKRMQHGFAARNGLFAALMARGGYVGIKKVLERPFGGFLATFSQGSGKEPRFCSDEVTNELGTKWQTWGARVKPYASMAGTHPTIDCIRKLQEEHPEKMKDLKSIVSIKLDMGDAAFHHGGWEAKRPLTTTGAQMSNSYIAATQLVDGQVLAAQFRHDMLERSDLWELVDKTTCNNTLVAFQQRATVTFTDGTTLVGEVNAARGVDPPLSNEEVLEKWRLLTKELIDDDRREKIENLCLGMESLTDVSELGKLMSGITKNPIA